MDGLRQLFHWSCIIANFDKAIIGADFLKQNTIKGNLYSGTIRSVPGFKELLQEFSDLTDGYVIPHILDFTTNLHGKYNFTTLNLVRAHYQILIEHSIIPKTVIPIPLYELYNAANIFQRYIQQILKGLDLAYSYIF